MKSLPTTTTLLTLCAIAALTHSAHAQATPAPGRTLQLPVYLNVPGEPFSFMGAGISPRDGKPQFGAGFVLTERVFVTGMRLSYDSGYNAAGAWGWTVNGEGGQPRVDWVVRAIPATLKLGVAEAGPASGSGAMVAVPFREGAVPGYSVSLAKPGLPAFEAGAQMPAGFSLTAQMEMTWQAPAAPAGATVAEPRFWGTWPTLTLDVIPQAAAPGNDPNWNHMAAGTRNGGFHLGNTDWWSTQSFNGNEVEVIPKPGGAADDYVARLPGATPAFLSQYTYATDDDGNPVDMGVVAFDCQFGSATGVLRVLLHTEVLGTIRGSAALVGIWKRHYLDIPPSLNIADIPLAFHYEDPDSGQDLLLDNVGYSALQVWQNPADPRDGGAANFVHAGNLVVELGNGAIFWGTANDNGVDVANRYVTITGNVEIDEFSWLHTRTLTGAGNSPYGSTVQGGVTNHGLLALGTATDAGSGLTVVGPLVSDGRIETHGATLTLDSSQASAIAGQVTLDGGGISTVNGARLAGGSLNVTGTGLFDVTYADGSAVSLVGAMNYTLEGNTTGLGTGTDASWSGTVIGSGLVELAGGARVTLGSAGLANAGAIALSGTGTQLTMPADANPANWREFSILGTGTLTAATGTTLELIAGSADGADQHARIANAVQIAAGAALTTRRPTDDPATAAGTNTITGGLVNHGALVLGDNAHVGSHLAVSGGFQSNGTISTKDGILTVHDVPEASIGGSLDLSGGGLRGTGATIFAAANLAITGQGTVDARFDGSGKVTRTNFDQTGGTLSVSGGQLVWSGSVGSAASLGVSNGAEARIPDATTVTNDGQLVAASGAVIHAPAFVDNAQIIWPERRINGSGRIDIGAGGSLDLDPIAYHNVFGWQAYGPVKLENDVNVGTGGQLLVRQAYVGEYYNKGTATILGELTNAGTVNLGTLTVVGSHLSVRGGLANTGAINLHGCTLSLDGSATGTVGGQVNLDGGSFVTNDTAAIVADNLTIRGGGSVALNVLSGQVNFLGADTSFSLSGAVPAGLIYHLGEGAQMNLGTSFSNDGQVRVDAGSVFKAPWVGWGGWWNENTLAGTGAIAVGAGGRMEMTAAEFHYWDWHQYMWLAVDNGITIAPGGELRNLQGVMQEYYGPGTNLIRGPLVNQGTINLGTESIAGSHLRVTGSFANSGVINLYGRNLYVSPTAPDALAQFGGQVNLFGGYFGDESAPVSPGQNPVIRGTGTVALQLAGGQVNLNGGATSFTLRGGLGAGAKLVIDGGAYAEIGPITYPNGGEILATGPGTILRGPQQGEAGLRKFTGTGVIRIADGARMEVESFTHWEWGWHYDGWTQIENDVDIQAGGEFKTLSLAYSPGWTEIYGHLANAGTLNVAMPLRTYHPVENQGLIRLGSSLEIAGKLTNAGVLLYAGGGVSASGGIEQLPAGEIRFTTADPYTIAKTGGGHMFVKPGQQITFPADSTIDGWELSAVDGTVARIPTAQTGVECTLTGQWLAKPGSYGSILNLAGTDGRIIVLEMSYADPGLGQDFERSLYLRWRNDAGEFVHATAGNTGERGDFAVEQFHGSWETLAASGHGLADLLGSYGIDTQRNRVWAVINRASVPNGEWYGVTTNLVNPAFQAWLAAKGLTGAPGFENGPNDDPDQDGRVNLEEFAFDGDPLSAGSDHKLVAKVATLPDVGMVLTFTLPVRDGAVFFGPGDLAAAIDGLVYLVQGSIDLMDFTTPEVAEITGPDALAIQAGLPALSSGWTYRTFRLPDTVGGPNPRAFLRAGVEQF